MNLIQLIETLDNSDREDYTYQIRCVHDDGEYIGRTTTPESITYISIYKLSEEDNLHYWVADFSPENFREAVCCFMFLSDIPTLQARMINTLIRDMENVA